MCGCYSLTTPRDTLRKVLAPWLANSSSSTWLSHYAPRAEIHPGEPVLALIEHQRHTDVTHFLWGFLASWVKDPWRGPRPIIARTEALAENHLFAQLGVITAAYYLAMVFMKKGTGFIGAIVNRSG